MLIKPPRLVEVLVSMANTPFGFNLTGSRFFGHGRCDSDWDFFVDRNTPNLVRWLEDNGFEQKDHRNYSDTSDITQVWQHNVVPIDIQVVGDANLKALIQSFLKSDSRLGGQLGNLPKDVRRIVWNVAYAAFEEKKKILQVFT